MDSIPKTTLPPDKPDELCQGEELATVMGDLQYEDREEVAIVLNYFYSDEQGEKIPLVDLLDKAIEESGIGEELGCYEIWDGLLIHPDEEHSGTIFVPKRIVESNPVPYADSDLEPFDIDYVKAHIIWKDDDDEAKEVFNGYEFSEPMMVTQVINYQIIDPTSLEWDDWLEYEQIAEYHNLRYKDCDEASCWREG